MPIVHVKKNHNFRRDKRLSWKARGILAYLVDHEDTWEVSVQDLINQSKEDGRTSVQNALQELVKAHYATLIPLRDALGKVQGKHYVIYESPYDLADEQENRPSGNPSVGEDLYAVVEAHRRTGFPTVGKTDGGKTCSITKKDLKDKNQRKEKKSSHDTSPSRKDHQARLEEDAHNVLAYFNHVHGRNLERTTYIRALLGTGVTIEDCKLVIDWLFHVDRIDNPEGYQKYADNVTPFRPDNFDRLRDKAKRWQIQRRTGATTRARRVVL